jgi:ATP-dependent RNA helicase DeaD
VAITLVEPRQHRLLKTIEKATKQKIAVETLPTVADLRARRLELTRGALEAALAEDEHEQFRVVVDALSADHDLMEIALAAVKLAHEANGIDEDETEIPAADPAAAAPRKRADPAATTTVFVSLGHAAKIRPQDLVGAITGETSLSGRQIGAIEITHKYSTVEVPKDAAKEVIQALSKTLIKGRKARVERYRPPSRKGDRR